MTSSRSARGRVPRDALIPRRRADERNHGLRHRRGDQVHGKPRSPSDVNVWTDLRAGNASSFGRPLQLDSHGRGGGPIIRYPRRPPSSPTNRLAADSFRLRSRRTLMTAAFERPQRSFRRIAWVTPPLVTVSEARHLTCGAARNPTWHRGESVPPSRRHWSNGAGHRAGRTADAIGRPVWSFASTRAPRRSGHRLAPAGGTGS